MEFIRNILTHINDLPNHLNLLSNQFGTYIYLIFFINMFLETGGVVLAFLPGDTFVVAAAALCANTSLLDIKTVTIIFLLGTFLGDVTNFHIGKYFGKKYVDKSNMKLIKPEQFDLAQDFFNHNGKKGFLFHRFIPFARGLVPFSTGFLQTDYKTIFPYHLIGVILWNTVYITLGYFFGNIPYIRNNFSLVLLLVVACALTPATVVLIKNYTKIINSKFLKMLLNNIREIKKEKAEIKLDNNDPTQAMENDEKQRETQID